VLGFGLARHRRSWYWMLDEAGQVVLEQKLSTTPKVMENYAWTTQWHSYWGPSSAFGVELEAERSRAGSSRIAYPARADMMDPARVRKSELA